MENIEAQIEAKAQEYLERIRHTKGTVKFVQVGAYDGVSYGDLAHKVTKPSDHGFFIEPVKKYFDILKENKKEYVNSKFYNIAIIPYEDFYSEYFHIDHAGGQSTFMFGVYYDDVPATERWSVEKVEVQTIKNFIDTEVKETPDIYFIDAECYDNDIVRSIISFENAPMIYFEALYLADSNQRVETNGTNTPKQIRFTTRAEIMDILKEAGYEYLYTGHPGEDILCWKK